MIGLSGRLRSALIIGGQGIRARKLRTLLSMLSLFLGVLAVVAVQTGSEFAQKELLTDAELSMAKDGTLQMYLPHNAKTGPIALESLRGRPDAVGSFSMQATIGEPNLTPVNPGGMPFDRPGGGPGGGPMIMRCSAKGDCTVGPQGDAPPTGAAIEVNLVALTGDIRQFRPFRTESGQWLDFAGTPGLAPRIVLNKEAAKGFSRYRVPAQMHVQGATADTTPQIIGVIEDGNGYQATAYVRADELLNWLPADQTSSQNYYGSGVSILMDPAGSDLERILRSKLEGAGVKDQIYTQVVNSRERVESQLRLMRLVFLAMAALVLLIGTAGILNVGLATVGERVEEFALRRAVGTPRVLLAGIVLAETLLTGLMTAMLAIGTGALGLRFAASLFRSRFPSLSGIEFPWQAGVAGVIAGLAAGLLGGLIPAIRAARIPIATVMRA
ncbi:ABC transporter permease [Actinocrispum wychmicini]|uniref:Putative ABC transport system permease protein n=1 Tax=Actinocrispum wychmicini TaxID=1213861 RepID=A0A4R2JE48_9PSEU|nr:ABC transporter permease [Actinocrispum wychmicini]TCO55156.1 putative ABC transport system permease protein [Actinocrispum wychmicini]